MYANEELDLLYSLYIEIYYMVDIFNIESE